ncbi:MAG: pyruvoyl-dependent arginine decarboxylase [Nanoarchaeota archaeon]
MQQVIVVSEQAREQGAESSILLGNRIPKDFFITEGSGESDITVHAGSYHLALKDAGIECYNILTYSSILPAIATQVEKPAHYVHGSVAETIMAAASSTKGIRATAGIIFGWLYDKVTGKKYGGLVCEYNGAETEEEAGNSLRASLKELYLHGFSEGYDLGEIQLLTRSFVPQKKFGTALVALVFTNYVVPVEG